MQTAGQTPNLLSLHSLEDVNRSMGGGMPWAKMVSGKLGVKLLGSFPQTETGLRVQAPSSSPSGLSIRQEEQEHFSKLV